MAFPNNTYLPGVIAIPSTLQITAITQSMPMTVTITFDPVTAVNTYIPGMKVKLAIPRSYNMWQANGLMGNILSITGSVFTLAIDSSHFDPFIVPAITAEQPANLVPLGSQNLQYSNNTAQVAFQSLNNIGN